MKMSAWFTWKFLFLYRVPCSSNYPAAHYHGSASAVSPCGNERHGFRMAYLWVGMGRYSNAPLPNSQPEWRKQQNNWQNLYLRNFGEKYRTRPHYAEAACGCPRTAIYFDNITHYIPSTNTHAYILHDWHQKRSTFGFLEKRLPPTDTWLNNITSFS